MLQTDGRNFGPAQLPARQDPTVTGDELKVSVDQHRYQETEGGQALCDLPDFFWRVTAWIPGIQFKLGDSAVGDGEARLAMLCPLGGSVFELNVHSLP